MRFLGHARSQVTLACAVCCLAIAAPASATDSLAFGGPVTLSIPGQVAAGPQLAADGAGNALAVFTSFYGANVTAQSAFKPASGAFASPVYLSDPEQQNAIDPQVAFDGAGNAIAVWTRYTNPNGIVQAAFRPHAGEF